MTNTQLKELRVDMMRYSGSDDFVTRLDRGAEGSVAVGDVIAAIDDSVDPESFMVAEVSTNGRYVRLTRPQ